VFRGGDGPDATEREPIDLGPLEKMGLITTLAADSEDETLTYIDLTLEMDDGEAMTGAIASHRGVVVGCALDGCIAAPVRANDR
jgi:hypothetical protein